jgi:hypothetical protein
MRHYYAALNMDRYMADTLFPWCVRLAHEDHYETIAYTENKTNAERIVNALNQMEIEC